MNTQSLVITFALLEKLKSPRGGYSRIALNALGIKWPPPRGWRKKLILEAKQNEVKAQVAELVPVSGPMVDIKFRFLLMTQSERQSLMADLEGTYCRHCWKTTEGNPCHCWNDE